MEALAEVPDPATRTVRCSHCGAQSSLASNVAATKCAFCSAPLASATELKSAPPAEGVVPFALGKTDAGEKFDAWLKGLWFRPSNLKRLGRLREVRGIYVPNWAFDANAYSSWTAEAGYYYYVEKVEIVNGEERRSRERQIRWEPAAGTHQDAYTNILISASVGLSGAELAAVEPFTLDPELTAFDGDFLAGFEAESHSRGLRESWQEAASRIVSAEKSACSRQVPGDTQRYLNVQTNTSEEAVCSLLVPLYIAAYEYAGQVYRVVINGQTGKATGKAPWSVWKIVGFILAMLALIGGILLLIQTNRH
jgi:hypothetical protein